MRSVAHDGARAAIETRSLWRPKRLPLAPDCGPWTWKVVQSIRGINDTLVCGLQPGSVF